MEEKNKSLRQQALDHMFIQMFNTVQMAEEGGPLIIDSANGIYITDTEGNTYIDGISGMYFRNVGHGRKEIAKAIYEQLSEIASSHSPRLPEYSIHDNLWPPHSVSPSFSVTRCT